MVILRRGPGYGFPALDIHQLSTEDWETEQTEFDGFPWSVREENTRKREGADNEAPGGYGKESVI